MNRLIVLTLAAAFSQLALGCANDRTEIYEPASTVPSDSTPAQKLDTTKVSDTPDLNFPVPAAAPVPLDRKQAHLIDDHIDLISGTIQPGAVMPPVVDPTDSNNARLGADGNLIPVVGIDTNELTPTPGIGLGPLLALDPMPSHGQAQMQPETF